MRKGRSKGSFASGHMSRGLRRIKYFQRKYSQLKPQKEEHYFVLKCKNCGKEVTLPIKRRKMKFCSKSCASIYNNLHKKKLEDLNNE